MDINKILCNARYTRLGSHLTRGAWIETSLPEKRRFFSWSHLAGGAWIEMYIYFVEVVFHKITSFFCIKLVLL